MAYTLPPLAYPYNALEPHIDARTMEIHHTKHHQAYINNVNNAIKGKPDLESKSVEQLIADINAIATANNITISNISFQSTSTPILVTGSAPSETQIAAFRDAIQSDPHFGTVNLPLLNIQANGGLYTFSMSFSLSSTEF